MLKFYRKNLQEGSFSTVSGPEKNCWIHAENATGEDIEKICALTKLHVTDLLDALDRYELPRVEVIQNNLLFFTRHPVEQESHLHTMPITVLMTEEYLVTISPSNSALIRGILESNDTSTLSNVPDFFVRVLLKVAQEFAGQIRQKRNSVMAQGKEIGSVDSDDISVLTKQEETLNQYLSCLELFHAALKTSNTLEFPLFCKQCHRDIDDIKNSVKQSENLCSSLIKNIRSLRDSCQIIFANKLTKTIKLLTALTIIFSIPNIVASIYGMNVKLPLADRPDAFGFLMVIMFIISGLCGYWFYRKKWM